MRSFKQLQDILGTPPNIKKIYLIGCTGAGKTSLVQHIIDTKKYEFPVTSHRRTTVAPTEYVIQKDRPFKATIILKQKKDVEIAIEELIQSAILKAKQGNCEVEDVIYELEQSPDERFKLNQMVKNKTFSTIAHEVIHRILPAIEGKNLNDETLLSESEIKKSINKITEEILNEIEESFKLACGKDHKLFSDEPIIIENIESKDEFIIKCKKLLSHDFGSISILAEYIRIEGDLLANWLSEDFEFVLIDGEGIGHSLGEKRDTLSARHYDYFNYCNNVVLVDDANDPFAAGGHGAIEGIFLNGYEKKLRLVFSKVDKLEQSDQNAYFRRSLNNLRNALKKDQIEFTVENKDTYKLNALNDRNINDDSKKSIQNLLRSINKSSETNTVPLEYDFDLLLKDFSNKDLVKNIQSQINCEHWTVIKALSRRLYNFEVEYKHLKPVSWILMSIMREISHFLQRNDLSSEVLDSQNIIKQKFSQELINYIFFNLIIHKEHLWQQAFEKRGVGSNKERQDFISGQILNVFLPSEENEEAFNSFKEDIKKLLITAGALELKTAIKTEITHLSIKKIFGYKNLEWTLGDDTSILIGKNGCGKSTVLKLIYACLQNDKEVLESFNSPYIELTLLKTFDNGETQESVISHSKSPININVKMVNTFDNKDEQKSGEVLSLDKQLQQLMAKFGEFQRNLVQAVNKRVGEKMKVRDSMIKNLDSSTSEDFINLQKITSEINKVTEEINAPLLKFTTIIDSFFDKTGKSIVFDHESAPIMFEIENKEETYNIKITDLSSGEKQLLIIFLTVILQKNSPFILLMDEPETSLHVEWQAVFIDKIKELNPNIQIIIATHNPLILLNREQDEIGIIELNNEKVQKRSRGTKYLDISSILLDHFQLSSLIGNKMQKDIKRFTELKLNEDNLTYDEKNEIKTLKSTLEESLAGDIIYNKKYFQFLKFLKVEKKIELDTYEKATDEEMEEFLSEFGDI
ncbi:AAA family ATPase [Pseudoalteromonas sp. M58]|uniref:AAA family ATPase n=1 Tax=Pseudoalteromonas sp. M58 TaxID=3141534 RepID=UPI003670D586